MHLSLLKIYLRKFILVFFDDILIYNQSLENHLKHFQIFFELLKTYSLFVKRSKCVLCRTHIEYLDRVISGKGVLTDPYKIQAILDWPVPKTTEQLKGFLGLIGYYRRFMKGFGSICKPLTHLLMNDVFMWDEKAVEAFINLKEVMTNLSLLTPTRS